MSTIELKKEKLYEVKEDILNMNEIIKKIVDNICSEYNGKNIEEKRDKAYSYISKEIIKYFNSEEYDKDIIELIGIDYLKEYMDKISLLTAGGRPFEIFVRETKSEQFKRSSAVDYLKNLNKNDEKDMTEAYNYIISRIISEKQQGNIAPAYISLFIDLYNGYKMESLTDKDKTNIKEGSKVLEKKLEEVA